MQPFTRLTAVAAPLDIANIDTDQIIPARYLSKARGPGYERWGFHDMRYETDGREKPGFVLNQAPYRNAQILVATSCRTACCRWYCPPTLRISYASN